MDPYENYLKNQASIGNKTDDLTKIIGQTAPGINPQAIIRTYEGDAAQAIQKKNASVATIVLAENMRNTNSAVISNAPQSNAGTKLLYVFLSLILIAAGAGAAYYFYLQSPLAPAKLQPLPSQTITSIVPPNSSRNLDLTAKNNLAIIAAIRQAEQDLIAASSTVQGSISEFTFTEKSSVNGSTTKISVADMLGNLNLNPPDILTRSLTPKWMFGVYQGEKQDPFIILTTTFFQNTYAGMIKWEPTMADEMTSVFTYPDTTTVSTSSRIAKFFSIRGKFDDAVIKNKDVRIFRNEAGQILLMYSFIDPNTLVITSSGAALLEVIDRIEKKAFIR